MRKTPKKKKDPGILVRVWKQEGSLESVNKFYIDRSAKTVDIDLWVSSTTQTQVQCNYPAKIVDK